MKRSILSAAAFTVAVIMAAMCLTACGGESKNGDGSSNGSAVTESTAAAKKETLTEKDGTIGGKLEDGTYKLTGLSIDGNDSKWLMSSLEKGGVNTDLIVKGEKVTILEVENILEDGKLISNDGTSAYAVKGSVITVLDDEGTKMVFEKE